MMRTLSIVVLSLLPMLSLGACAQEAAATPKQSKAGQDPVPSSGQVTLPSSGQVTLPSDGQVTLPSDFVRYVKVGDGGHLDTAITTYEKDGVTVIFYGAVHIADANCYDELNDRFTTCDALLYELVGPENYRPTKDREGGGSFISLLQNGMKKALEMSFQLDVIDYQVDNFVHADMTPQEFQSSMAANGESLLSIMWGMMKGGMEMQREQADRNEGKKPEAFDLVKAFQTGEGRHLMRTTFAQQLEQMEMLSAGGEGSTLLEGRNEKCLKVLQREIKNGKKRLGIYYGAAHLPHMEMRLVDDLGFKKVAHEWLVAWDCKKRPDPKFDRELNKQRRLCKKQMAVLARAARDHRRAVHPAAVPTPRELFATERDGKKVYVGALVDPWGSDYVLRQRQRGSRWEAVSYGQDKKPNTEDDIIVVEPRLGGL